MARPCVVLTFVAALLPVNASAAEKIKPEEVVAHHLDAVGAEAARAAGRSVEGSCSLAAPAAGGVAGTLVGRFVFDSEASRVALRMKFAGLPGGELQLRGRPGRSRIRAAGPALRPRQLRQHERRDPARGPAGRRPQRRLAALRPGRAGRELHRLRYRAKKGQDALDIFLYFDPDTFRHVASVYKASKAQQLGTTMESSSSEPDMYLQVEETFGNFKSAKGVTLPAAWTIRYEMQAKVTQHWKYELAVETLGK